MLCAGKHIVWVVSEMAESINIQEVMWRVLGNFNNPKSCPSVQQPTINPPQPAMSTTDELNRCHNKQHDPGQQHSNLSDVHPQNQNYSLVVRGQAAGLLPPPHDCVTIMQIKLKLGGIGREEQKHRSPAPAFLATSGFAARRSPRW